MATVLAPPQPAFRATLARHGVALARTPLRVAQVNLGKLCNQACTHCHVDAGPKRTEIMDGRTCERVIALLDTAPSIDTLDITGGAPELNPGFRALALAGRARGLKVIDRCNLTVLHEPGQEDTAAFLATNGIDVVASLPCYTRENVDAQRGRGVFEPSIDALRMLNALGYGHEGSGLQLDLVYNPGGAFLPAPQEKLQADYRAHLGEEFDIVFNRLYTITNMPISRFRHSLEREGRLQDYMQLLVENFNPHAAAGVMCRDLVSIGWDGELYDCDFNQMLELPLGGRRTTIWDIESLAQVEARPIALGQHCYGCTAGAGSSCGGALA